MDFFVCFLFCGMDATCFVGGVVECDLFCCSYCCSFAAMLYYPALLGDTDSAIRSWYGHVEITPDIGCAQFVFVV
jgi:hypothetical protein